MLDFIDFIDIMSMCLAATNECIKGGCRSISLLFDSLSFLFYHFMNIGHEASLRPGFCDIVDGLCINCSLCLMLNVWTCAVALSVRGEDVCGR